MKTELSHAIDLLFQDYDRPDGPGSALGIIRHGELIYSRGYGMASLDHRIPITSTTAFEIASEAKQFTAACIALMVEDGELNLEDDICRYVPAIPTFGCHITLDHLIHHTSGIPDYHERFTQSGLAENVWSQEKLIEYALDYDRLEFVPGDRCAYSNTGYLLLAAVMQQVAGKPFSRFAQERIFEPLGMTHTLVHDDRQQIVLNRALGYARRPEGGWRLDTAWNETVPGDGKVFSTVEDLLLWDRNLYEPRIGRGGFGRMMRQRGRLNDGSYCRYAFGLDLGQFSPAQCAGYAVETHGGGHAGFESILLRLPEAHLSVILLCNTKDNRFKPAAYTIAEMVLAGDEPLKHGHGLRQ